MNWAFSEFIGMVQEIHNASLRPDTVFIESRQLKVGATCFELAISLLRVLEMISTIAKDVFTDNLLARLCQVILFSRIVFFLFKNSWYFKSFV